jgi:hypothetical protein
VGVCVDHQASKHVGTLHALPVTDSHLQELAIGLLYVLAELVSWTGMLNLTSDILTLQALTPLRHEVAHATGPAGSPCVIMSLGGGAKNLSPDSELVNTLVDVWQERGAGWCESVSKTGTSSAGVFRHLLLWRHIT